MEGLGEVILILVIILIIVVAAAITVYILFLVNLRNLLREISESNRRIPANNVFLILIPIFGLFYSFIMFPKISESIKLEYEMRERTLPGDGLKSLGLVFSILMLLSAVMNNLFSNIAGLFSLGMLVILIVYWVQSSRIKKELMNSGGVGHRTDLLD